LGQQQKHFEQNLLKLAQHPVFSTTGRKAGEEGTFRTTGSLICMGVNRGGVACLEIAIPSAKSGAKSVGGFGVSGKSHLSCFGVTISKPSSSSWE